MSTTKKFPATKRRLRQARKDGDLLRSRLLTTAAGFTASALWFWLGADLGRPGSLYSLSMRFAEEFSASGGLDIPATGELCVSIVLLLADLVCIPLFLAATAGICLEVIQTGGGVFLSRVFNFPTFFSLDAFRQKWGITATSTGEYFGSRVAREAVGKAFSFLGLLGIVSVFSALVLGRIAHAEFLTASELLYLIQAIVLPGSGICLALFWLAGSAQLLFGWHSRRKRLLMTREEFERELKEQRAKR